MNRLTKRNGTNFIARNQYCDYDAVLTDIQLQAAYQQCVDKLGALEDMFNDYAKDGDRALRNIRISLNDFFNYNIDFENYDLEKGDKNEKL